MGKWLLVLGTISGPPAYCGLKEEQEQPEGWQEGGSGQASFVGLSQSSFMEHHEGGSHFYSVL